MIAADFPRAPVSKKPTCRYHGSTQAGCPIVENALLHLLDLSTPHNGVACPKTDKKKRTGEKLRSFVEVAHQGRENPIG